MSTLKAKVARRICLKDHTRLLKKSAERAYASLDCEQQNLKIQIIKELLELH